MFITLMQPEIDEPRVSLFNARRPRIRIELYLQDCGTLDMSLDPQRAQMLSARLRRLSNALEYEARRGIELSRPPTQEETP